MLVHDLTSTKFAWLIDYFLNPELEMCLKIENVCCWRIFDAVSYSKFKFISWYYNLTLSRFRIARKHLILPVRIAFGFSRFIQLMAITLTLTLDIEHKSAIFFKYVHFNGSKPNLLYIYLFFYDIFRSNFKKPYMYVLHSHPQINNTRKAVLSPPLKYALTQS